MIYLGKNAVGISDVVIGTPIDDTAGVGDTDKVWSADKTASEISDLADASVTDVQINGTSVVNNGVANVPIATTTDPGVVIVGNGLSITDGKLRVSPASDSQVKAGTATTPSLVPSRQHQSVFYGLAKAAGDSTQSASSDAVGTYTNAAKVAIQKMLGIYQAPWELIREDTFTNATSANYEITVDGNGQPFELTDIRLTIWFPVQSNEARYDGWAVRINYGTENQIDAAVDSKTQAAGSTTEQIAMVEIEQKDGMIKTESTIFGSKASYATPRWRYRFDDTSTDISFRLGSISISSIRLSSVTGTMNYILYGKRKWT